MCVFPARRYNNSRSNQSISLNIALASEILLLRNCLNLFFNHCLLELNLAVCIGLPVGRNYYNERRNHRQGAGHDGAVRSAVPEHEPDPPLLPELPGLPPVPEGARHLLRALQLLPQGLPLPLPQRVGGEVGRPARGGHLRRKDLITSSGQAMMMIRCG